VPREGTRLAANGSESCQARHSTRVERSLVPQRIGGIRPKRRQSRAHGGRRSGNGQDGKGGQKRDRIDVLHANLSGSQRDTVRHDAEDPEAGKRECQPADRGRDQAAFLWQ
jgi:hypothetical protein